LVVYKCFLIDCAGGVGTQTNLVGAQNVAHYPNQWCVLNPNADLSTLPANIEYACANADCTPLSNGGSCGGLTLQQNASYAFNTYYQFNQQLASACNFTGLAQVVTTDPSVGTCTFLIGVKPAGSGSSSPSGSSPPSGGASVQAGLRVLVTVFIAAAIVGCSFLFL
jgi:hypothetical protein